MREPINPCPFCAFDAPEIRGRYQVAMERDAYVFCPHCGARGPVVGQRSSDAETERLAVQRWNRVRESS